MPHMTPTNLAPPSTHSGGLAPKLKKKKPSVMPTPHMKNKPSSRPKMKRQAAPKPYDPYAPLDPKAIEENARVRAQSQIQPTLDNLSSVERDTGSAHTARQGELGTWYGNFQGQLDKSYGNTAQALNQLIAMNAQGNTQAAAALGAALKASDQPVNEAAAMMGPNTPTPPNTDAAILAAAQANAANQNNFIGASAANNLTAAGTRDATLAGIGRIDAGNQEDRRYNAQVTELRNQRQDALGQLPNLVSTARSDIQGQETQKAQLGEAQKNRLFQQYLSEQELGLKKRNQSFQEWLGQQNLGLSKEQLGLDRSKLREQTAIDWANIGINRTQAEAQLEKIKADARDAKHGDRKERAQLRAKAWTTGLDLLSSYMSPQDGEGPIGEEDQAKLVDKDGNPLKVYRRSYDDALRTLTGKARMSRADALKILQSSDFPSWRARARKEASGIQTLKRGDAAGAYAGLLNNKPTSKIRKKPPVKLRK